MKKYVCIIMENSPIFGAPKEFKFEGIIASKKDTSKLAVQLSNELESAMKMNIKRIIVRNYAYDYETNAREYCTIKAFKIKAMKFMNQFA